MWPSSYLLPLLLSLELHAFLNLLPILVEILFIWMDVELHRGVDMGMASPLADIFWFPTSLAQGREGAMPKHMGSDSCPHLPPQAPKQRSHVGIFQWLSTVVAHELDKHMVGIDVLSMRPGHIVQIVADEIFRDIQRAWACW